jgi:putative phage-type endonuclease
MSRKFDVVNTIQGTDEWLAERQASFTASEAPAMMGASPHTSRTELLTLKKTGTAKEVSDFVQKNIYDKGHKVEALGREIIENRTGEELFPITGRKVVSGMVMMASSDGLTITDSWGSEHKQWNKTLPAKVEAGDIDPQYYWQMEHQLMVFGCEYILFVVSDGTEKNMVEYKYYPVPGRREELIAGWRQFAEDLITFIPKEVTAELVATPIERLPAILVEVEGEVKGTNLEVYRGAALTFIENINTNLETDQDFLDAKATVKFCKDAEAKLEAVKDQVLAQTASIEEVFRTIDDIGISLSATRRSLDKQVKTEETARKNKLVTDGLEIVNNHLATVTADLGGIDPHVTIPSLAASIKGKRSLGKMEDAIDTAIANWKKDVQIASLQISNNLALVNAKIDFKFLFTDLDSFIRGEPNYVTMLIDKRINDYEVQQEEKRKAEAAEKKRIAEEAERIAEEKVKAEAARIEREKIEEAERIAEADRIAAETIEGTDTPQLNAQEAPSPAQEPAAPASNTESVKAVVNRRAVDALVKHGFTFDRSKQIVTMIVKGEIPNVSIHYDR